MITYLIEEKETKKSSTSMYDKHRKKQQTIPTNARKKSICI